MIDEEAREKIAITYCMNSACYPNCSFKDRDCPQVKVFTNQILTELHDKLKVISDEDFGKWCWSHQHFVAGECERATDCSFCKFEAQLDYTKKQLEEMIK